MMSPSSSSSILPILSVVLLYLSLITIIIHQIDSAEIVNNKDDEITQWKSLIDKLRTNKGIETYAKAKTRAKFKTVQEVGEYLAKCPYVQNDTEKAWLVFLWITDNIGFDVKSYLSDNKSKNDAQNVLTRGSSTCYGYSEFFNDLSKRLGIESVVSTSGYSKAFGYRVGNKLTKNHRWNAFRAKEDGMWRYVDSTWGAGHVSDDFKFEKELDPYQFATPPFIFNERHFSDEFYVGRTQKSLEEFESAQANEIYFHLAGLKCSNCPSSEIRLEF